MALKIALKPYEKIIIAGAVVTNGGSGTSLIIENNVPVLREKDILKEENADSPARRIYFVVQLMYLDENNLALHHQSYWGLVRDFLSAAPSSMDLIRKISVFILNAEYYKALKLVQKLIDYEQFLIS
ncbi:MAG: flagellar biosynthesis repressor FlbT [Smithella sp.]